ncbi:PEP-CTERM sorting domain-containing protein [uncultured Thiohalocapsa sp.]|uniref:PEP-CTERM sorting domain-containing protein n=1 Tax=uncultured Thiohalocapsa sp. TaxID=768990 RepID=UPI0025F0DD01|nr:PEP-CTERM sorting domain-containing protein [uncultured Thiohalocapsa sp.]
MTQKYLAQAAGFSGLLLLGGLAHAVTIDNFDVGPYFGSSTIRAFGDGSDLNNPTNQPGLSTSDVIGGVRDTELTIPNSGNGADEISATVSASTGYFQVSNSSSAAGTATLTWDGGGTLGGLDLTNGGLATGFFLGIPEPIDNELDITFTVNGSSTESVSFPNGSEGDDFFIPFASFSDPAVFTTVDVIQMSVTGPNAYDATIDLVETRPRPVPVPGTLALLGLGLAGLGLRRRKRVA